MRVFLRPLATLVLAVGVATCSDTPIATVKTGTSPALARAMVSLQPSFSKSAQFAAEHAADFGIDFDSVHIVIRGLPDTNRIVLDTTVRFTRTSPDLPLELTVPVHVDGERFDAGIGYTLGGTVQYYGHGPVQSHAPNTPAPPQPVIVIDYHGRGANVARLSISPRNPTLNGTGQTTLSVAAFDSSGASMTPPPLLWSSSNESIATVSALGVVQAQNRRGSATISVQSPTLITDGVPVSVTLAPAAIVLAGGGGQSGKAGAALPNPAVVQVNAADGIGVAGASVIFSAPTGGAVNPATATTDANGRASTNLTLGNTAGPQGFAASSNGFSVAISATATAADPSAITIVSGNNQTDSIKKTLAPLSVRVADRFGNPVSGASVAWTRTAGSGSLASPTSTTNADGVATNTYTLGSAPGAEGVSASITGASVAFTFTTSAGGGAAIVAVSGDAQTGRVAQALAAPFVVRVNDAGGNPVANAVVAWGVTNGSITSTSTTDASGQASATFTGGTVLGAASATAKIANGQSVTFNATLQAGNPSQLAFTTQPVNGTPNVTLSAVRVALRDVGGNATTSTNSVTIALGNNPNGAVLSGTLTRSAVGGVATFDDLKLDKAGSGYTLTATSTGLTAATSNAFSTSIGGATQLILVPSTPTTFTKTAGGAVPNPPKLKTADAAGNAVGNVAVLFTVTQGATTIGTQTLNTDASGFIDAASLNTPDLAGTYTITGSLVSAPSVTLSVTLTVTPGTAFKLSLVNKGLLQTSVTSGSTLAPQPSIQLVDQFGNATPAGTMNVTASLTGTGVTLGGTTQISLGSTSGAASFSNLSLSGTGSTRIAFTEGSGLIKTDTTANITVAVGAASQLVMTGAPTSNPMAQIPMSAISVSAKDANGNVVTAESGTVTLSAIGCSNCLQGTLSQTLVNGQASFTGVSFTAAGSNISLRATYGSLTATSSSFTVDGAPIITAVVATYNVASGGSASPAPKVHVTKADGVTALTGRSITFTPTNGGGAITRGAASSITFPSSISFATDANGDAALDAWAAPSGVTSGSVTLAAAITGTSLSTTFTMNISNANLTVDAIAVASLPSSSVANNATFSPTVQLKSGSTNVPRAGVVVSATLTQTPTPVLAQGTTTGTITATTDANGIATFSNLRVVGTSGVNFSVHFATTSLTSNVDATTSNILIDPGAAQRITLLSGNNQVALVGTTLPTGLFVQLVDTSGNTATSPSATVSFSTSNGSVTSSAGTNGSGQATATWTLGATEGAQSMQASTTIGGINSSVTFSATGADVHAMVFSQSPSTTGTIGATLATQPWIQLQDANGNNLSKSGVVITASVADAPGGPYDVAGSLSLGGTLTATTDATGLAKFTNLSVSGLIRPGQLRFAKTSGTSQTLTDLTSLVTLSAGSASSIINNSSQTVSLVEGGTLGSGQYPSVKVSDASGNGIPNSSVVVTYTVTDGACSISSGSPAVDALGLSTLTSTGLSIPGVAGSCVIHAATSPSLGTFDFNIVIAPNSGITWLGTLSNVFSQTTNWRTTSGGAPTSISSSDAIYIPKHSGNTPTLSADAAVASVKIEPGGSIALNTKTLTVYGDVNAGTVAAGGGINNGTLSLESSSSASIQGPLPTTNVGASTCSGGSFSLGAQTTTGPLTVNCPLTIGAQTLTTISNGDLTTAGADGRLVMQTANGLVDVAGASHFNGASEVGYLTNGTFEARGSFSQTSANSSSSYAPSGSHKTSLWGGSAQSVSFEDPVNSFFYDAEVRNSGITATFTTPVLVKNNFAVVRSGASGNPEAKFSDTLKVVGSLTVGNGASLTFTSGASRRRIIVGGAVTDSSSSDLGGVDTLLVTGSTFPNYINGTAGKAPKLTQLTGTVSMTTSRTVAGGLEAGGTSLTLAGSTLTVLDSVNVTGNLSFLTASGGTLKVGRRFKIAGSGTVTAQAGTLELASDFTQSGTVSNAFQPSSGFLTKFTGTSAQSISFSDPGTGATKSYFRDVTITNSNASGVTFSTDGSVLGALLVSGGVLKTGSGRAITAMGTVTSTSGSELSGIVELIDSASTFPSFAGNSTPAKTTVAYRSGFMTLGGDVFLTGALSVKGNLSVGSHKLTTQDLTVESTGILSVANITDSVVVKGNAEFKGDQSNNPFTAGAFDFKGNFKSSSTASFYTGTGHNNTVRFTGTSAQSVDISGTDNYFANVAIGEQYNSGGYTISNSDVTFSSGATVNGVMDLHTSGKLTVPASTTLTISTLDPALNFHEGSIMIVNGTVLPVRPNCYRDDSNLRSLGLPQINGNGTFDGATVSPGSASPSTIFTSCIASSQSSIPLP